MVTIELLEKHEVLVHTPGHAIIADSRADAGGRHGPSPEDLLLAALGS